MKRFFIFALVATLFASCSTDTTQDLAPEIPTAPDELQVSFDEETSRIQLGENGSPVWTKGDLVSVFYRSNAHDKYEFTGETGDTGGTLKRVSQSTPTMGLDKVVAVYPYNANYLLSPLSGNIKASLPAEQTYLADSYGVGSSIMVSSSQTDRIYMKNVCGWLKLQFTGEGTIEKIVLRGNNSEQVAGDIYICSDDASCTLAGDLTGADGTNSGDLEGALVGTNTILTSVMLNCGDGVTLNSETPTAFYIALPPQTFEKGFTATMYGCDGSTKEISTENSITIERNHILPMASAEIKLSPATNQIWYTSSDGNVIEPNATDVFGANITSNTYENGVGVITFDGDVTTIGDQAFISCSSLTSVTIGNSVTTIGSFAFYDCDLLTSVTIGNSVTTIGDDAFCDCTRLTSVTIPDSVTTIGRNPFLGCSSLTAFYGKFASADNRCLIVDGVLNSFAPAGLTEYTIPDSVTTIGMGAFNDCSSLISVTIPNSVTTIGNAAFYNCSSLTSVTIGNSVTTIGESAFNYCSKLTSVTMPDSVTTIGNGAFYYCTSLKEVYCEPTTPPSLGGRSVFDNNASDRKIYVPTASVDAYKTATRWSEYASAIVAMPIPNNQICYTSSDGNVVAPYKTDVFGANILSNTYENGVGVITFDGDITTIGEDAFYYCSSLTSVTIPDSVTKIEKKAFYYSKALTSVTIGDGVTEIGEEAFASCDALKEVYCKPTTPPALKYVKETYYDSDYYFPITYHNYAFHITDDLKIYVPTDSYDVYTSYTSELNGSTAQTNWFSFKSYIEPYNFTE